MSALDTNLVLRLLLEDHPAQSPATVAMVAKGRRSEFTVEDVVLFECVWILQGSAYGFDRRLIADLITELTRIEQIACNRLLISQVMPVYVHHKAVSFIDIALAVYAELNGTGPLLTYDKKLAKALPHLVRLVA
ncbi:MAG TPA: PIN domain-containing protein [Candidatus Saccharimonadia bacterium]|nr:PIN domain-containing protein [Candidatus Saccharimonadia bacterium]